LDATGCVRIVVPASLLGNWKAEIERFAPSLCYRIAHPSAASTLSGSDLAGADIVITTYVRNGSVVDLQIGKGEVSALVSGSSLYTDRISIKQLEKPR